MDDGNGYAPHRWILWYDGHGASSNGEGAHEPTRGRILQRKRITEGWMNTSFLPICWDGLRIDGFTLGDGWIVHRMGIGLISPCGHVPRDGWYPTSRGQFVSLFPFHLPFASVCACACVRVGIPCFPLVSLRPTP